MIKFLSGQEVTPNFKKALKIAAVVTIGAYLGCCKANLTKQKYQNINDSKLIKYQTQDQINTLIQQTQKPAVIYYYFAVSRSHHLFRTYMHKYSNLYPNNCHWVMVSLTKQFAQAKKSFSLDYPNKIRLQVRHPKSKVAIKIGDESIQKVDHRRVPYTFDFREDSFKAFLQFNRIIKGQDPMSLTLQNTNKALFLK